jgi:hypothetical protein
MSALAAHRQLHGVKTLDKAVAMLAGHIDHWVILVAVQPSYAQGVLLSPTWILERRQLQRQSPEQKWDWSSELWLCPVVSLKKACLQFEHCFFSCPFEILRELPHGLLRFSSGSCSSTSPSLSKFDREDRLLFSDVLRFSDEVIDGAMHVDVDDAEALEYASFIG